jgi:hypothetical protein
MLQSIIVTKVCEICIRILLANSLHSEVPRGKAGDSHLDSIYGKSLATGIKGCGDCHLSFVSEFCWQIHFILKSPAAGQVTVTWIQSVTSYLQLGTGVVVTVTFHSYRNFTGKFVLYPRGRQVTVTWFRFMAIH